MVGGEWLGVEGRFDGVGSALKDVGFARRAACLIAF